MRVKFRSLEIPSATLVANEFIDRYMAKANGEFVKVYLWLLRHAEEKSETAEIADALELTEGDVNRALSYWTRTGLITVRDGAETCAEETRPAETGAAEEAAYGTAEQRDTEPEAAKSYAAAAEKSADPETVKRDAGTKPETAKPEPVAEKPTETAAPEKDMKTDAEKRPAQAAAAPAKPVPDKSRVDIRKLKNDEEFSNLLYVVQRYLSKIFSQTDTETVAYLYDVLKMPAELIEYLAEMCAERGKNSLRYIETVALNWHSRGIKTVEQAKREADLYTAETYGVMKAFGLSGRNPGTEEQKYIKKWFTRYGFTAELVQEACARTLAATQKPSFRYADSILTRWHDAGVHTKADVEKTDSEHQDKVRSIRTPEHSGKNPGNRFNNFEQRDDDIDEIALELMKKKLNQN